MSWDDLISTADLDALWSDPGFGPTYACWEAADRWMKAWRAAHPDEDRDDLDIFMSPDYPDALLPMES